MTKLLEDAIERVRQLPDSLQDNLAQHLLDEMEEELFDALIASRPDVLERLAEQALEDHRNGLTRPLIPEEL
jgi:hypothetical protein